MLLTKRPRFLVSEQQIKEELFAPDGATVLKINLRFPQIQCDKKDPLFKTAAPLYPRVADSVFKYAKTELYAMAQRAYSASSEDFLPFAALMRWENTFEDSDYLSILLDISASDGKAPPSVERKTQVWDRRKGTLCQLTDFASPDKLKAFAAEQGIPKAKQLCKNRLFVLKEKGIVLYFPNMNGYTSIFMPL